MVSARSTTVMFAGIATMLGCTRNDLKPQETPRDAERAEARQYTAGSTQSVSTRQSKSAEADESFVLSPAGHLTLEDETAATTHSPYPSTGVRAWDSYLLDDISPISTAGPTLLVAARALRADGRFEDATKVLEVVLAPVSNPDKRVSQWCRHVACLEISEMQESLGNLASALEYAYLARDTHSGPAVACGLSAVAQQQALQQRISSLQTKLLTELNLH